MITDYTLHSLATLFSMEDEQRIRISLDMRDFAPHEPALHNRNNKNLT